MDKIKELTTRIIKFRDLSWKQFHNQKMSFLWFKTGE